MIKYFYINTKSCNVYAKVENRKRGSLVYGNARGHFIKLSGKYYYFNEEEEKRFNKYMEN